MPIAFNPAQVDTTNAGGFPPIVKGWYQAFILEVAESATKANNGRYVMLKLQIVGGENDGRLIWHYMCYIHMAERTQNIGQAHLAMACQATGVQADAAGNLDPFAMDGKMLEFMGKCDADGNSNVYEYRAVQQEYAQAAAPAPAPASVAHAQQNQQATAKPQGQAQAAAPIDDDDIPF